MTRILASLLALAICMGTANALLRQAETLSSDALSRILEAYEDTRPW
jgi:hypothetical protein